MGAYLINCGSQEDLNLFRNKGFVGVKPKKPSDHPKSRLAALSNNYQIVVQLQVIKPHDLIFLYANGKIYGAYRAETRFMEHPKTPAEYQSSSLRFSFPEPCWRTYPAFSEPDFFWQLGISQLNGKCYSGGYVTQEKFTLRHQDKQWNLPGRFDFEEGWAVSKFTSEEAREITVLLKENNQEPLQKTVPAKRLKNFRRLRLGITVDKNGLLEHEKILESWLVEHASYHDYNLRNYLNVKNALGKSFSPDATLPGFYLGIFEALPFVTDPAQHSIQVIEIKKGYLERKDFLPLIKSLVAYSHQVAMHVCQNNLSKIFVTVIAKGFHPAFFNYLSVRKKVELGNPIRLVKYDVIGKRIVLTKVT